MDTAIPSGRQGLAGTQVFGMTATINEILALDLLTLREHTERAGDVLDADQHRVRLQASLEVCAVCSVRKAGELVAYAMLRPESETCWFVSGLSTHPLHRTPTVMSELLSKLAELAGRMGIVELRSNVYKTNRLSMAFHRKLGFHIRRENEKAVEFFAAVSTISGRPSVQRAVGKRGLSAGGLSEN
jgi:GNAT superfamily N-acetyltransferase